MPIRDGSYIKLAEDIQASTLLIKDIETGNLVVTTEANLGPVANVIITGGSNGESLLTDGAGNVSFGVPSRANTANTANTVTDAAQPNITSVGNLSSLTVGGNAVVGGNLTVGGNISYTNITQLIVEDPIIELGTGPNGNALTTNDGKDRGTLLRTFSAGANAEVNRFMGWDASGAEFIMASNASVSNGIVTINTFGNVHADNFIGNGSSLVSLTGENVTGTVANATYAVSAGSANTANSVSVANVSGIGNVATLNLNGNVNMFLRGNGTFGSIPTGALNYSQTLANAPITITSVPSTIISTSLTTNGNPVQITVYGDVVAWSAGMYAQLRLYRNNTALGRVTWVEASDANENQQFSLSVIDAPPAGAYSYSLRMTEKSGQNIIIGETDGPVIYAIELQNVKGDTGATGPSANTFLTVAANGTNLVANSSNATLTLSSGNNISITGNASSNTVTIGLTGTVANANYAAYAGNVTIAAQANITTVGTLGNLSVTANTTLGNLTVTGNAVFGPQPLGNFYTPAPISLTATQAGGVKTQLNLMNEGGGGGAGAAIDFYTYTGQGNGVPGSRISAVDDGNYSSNVSIWTKTTGNVGNGTLVEAIRVTSARNLIVYGNAQANFFIGSGNNLSNIQGANVSGTVANATYAASAGSAGSANSVAGANVSGTVANATYAVSSSTAATVTTAAQPNITSVGNLTSLTSNGTVNFTGASNVSLGAVGNVKITGGSNGQALITNGNGTLSWGNVAAGDAANAANANYANFAGSVTTATQGNITSVGTLTGLTVSGTTNVGAVGNLVITGGSNGYVLTTNGNGTLSWNDASGLGVGLKDYAHLTISGSFGMNTGTVVPFSVAQGTLSGASNGVTLKAGKTYRLTAAISGVGGWFNQYQWSTLAGATLGVSSFQSPKGSAESTSYTVQAVASAVYTPTVNTVVVVKCVADGGGVGSGLNATATWAYVEEIGSSTLTGNISVGAGANSTSSTTGAVIVNGGIGISGNAYVGTNLNVTGTTTLGAVGNLVITGGSNGQVLTTNGNGTLSWGNAGNATAIVNGNSNVIVTANGNVSTSVGGTANVFVVTTTGANVTGNVNVSGNITANGAPIYGVPASYAKYTRTTAQSVSANTVMVCPTAENTFGSDITVNTTTGNITLVAGRTYRLRGTPGTLLGSNSGAIIGYSWYNDTTDAYIGQGAGFVSSTSGAWNQGSSGTAEAIITPAVTTTVSFRITFTSNVSSIGGNVADWGSPYGYPWIDVEVIGGQAPITGFTTTGNISGGNIAITGTTTLGSVGNLVITGGSNGQALITNGNGVLTWGNVATGDAANAANANYANYAGNAFSVSGSNVSGTVANATYATTAGSADTANTANTANLATFATTANSVAGSNVSGTVANATYAASAGTVTTAAQGNITSVGTLTGLTVSGTTNLGAVGNVVVTGGSSGQVLMTNGSGGLSWANMVNNGTQTITGTVNPTIVSNVSPSSGTINGGSNSSPGLVILTLVLPTAGTWQLTSALRISHGGWVAAAFYLNGTLIPNSEQWLFESAAYVSQYGGVLSSIVTVNAGDTITVGAWSSTNSSSPINSGDGRCVVSATLLTAPISVQSSVGTMTSLSVSGTTTLGAVGNLVITGGSNGQALITNGNGVLTWGNVATGDAANAANANYANFAGTAYSVSAANVSGTVANATYAASAGSSDTANTANLATYATTANSVAGANVSGWVANANIANLATYATTANAVAGANVSGTVANATYATSAGSITGNVTTSQITGNGGVDIAAVSSTNFVTVTNNGHTSKFNPDGSFEPAGNIVGSSYGSNQLDVTRTAPVAVRGLLYGAEIVTSPDRANTFTWSFGTDGNLSAPGAITATSFSGNGAGLSAITAANITGTVANATYATSAGSSDTANTANTATFATTANAVAGANVSGTVANATYADTANIANTAYSVALANVTGITSYSQEFHVDPNGDDTTGTGSVLRPYRTIQKAVDTSAAQATKIVVHPGGYYESVTMTDKPMVSLISSATAGIPAPSTPAIYGNLTVDGNSTGIAISGISVMNTITHSSSGSLYLVGLQLGSSANVGTLSKTGSGYLALMDVNGATGVGANLTSVSITGNGPVTMANVNIRNLTVNNASTSVSVTSGSTLLNTTHAAGTLSLFDTFLYANANTTAAVTSTSSGGVLQIRNSAALTPTNTFARINVGAATVLAYGDLAFDRANSNVGYSANITVDFQSLRAANTMTATLFSGSGASLTALPGANVTGTVANATSATTAGTVTTAAQGNITSVGTLTSLTVSGNLTVNGKVSANSAYGMFWNSANIANPGANTAAAITWNAQDDTNGISYSGSNVTISRAGAYNVQFNAQVNHPSGGQGSTVYFWMKMDGVDVPGSGGSTFIAAGSGVIQSWNSLVTANENSVLQLYWASDATDITLAAYANTAWHPSIPSALITVTPVGA